MTALIAEQNMAGPKKSTPVRLADDALELARIASGYTGESVSEYVSRVILERAQVDIDRLHEQRFKTPPPKPKR